MVTRIGCAFLIILALVFSARTACSVPTEEAEVASTVEAFHRALDRGDGTATMNLLASDAVILESGCAQTRAVYEREHLPEDIKFAQTVRSLRSDVHVEIEGKTAWLTSGNRTEGSFEGKPINSNGVELAVLTKTKDGWRIRAIHWSSHRTQKAE